MVCAGDCVQNGSLDRLQEPLQNTILLVHREHMVREREREGESERGTERGGGGEKGREGERE